MSRSYTRNRNRIWRDDRNFIMVGNHKICRYLPRNNSFEFQVTSSRNIKQFVEVEKDDFIKRLKEVLT